MIKIVNPKYDYIAGTLVTPFHLWDALGDSRCEVYQWENTSSFLSELGVPQKEFVIESFIANLREDDVVIFNDFAAEKGHRGDDKRNAKYMKDIALIADKSNHRVMIINHTPFGRQVNYLKNICREVLKHPNVKALCYRQSHINTLEALRDQKLISYEMGLEVLPYFYSPTLLAESSSKKEKDIDILYLTRKSSNKPNSLLPVLRNLASENSLTLKEVDTSNPIHLLEGLKLYSRSKISISGYFHEEGTIHEINTEWNKLDWSAIDSVMNGCIFLTSTLFSDELERLGVEAITLPYKGVFSNKKSLNNALNSIVEVCESWDEILNENELNLYSEIVTANSNIENSLSKLSKAGNWVLNP